MSGNLNALQQISTFNGVINLDEEVRKKFSRDASIFEVKPAGVISPRTTNDIKAVVNWAVGQALAGTPVHFAPRVSGTCMSGGSLTEGYILDLKSHYNKIGTPDPLARTIRTQSGAQFIDIENSVKDVGLLFAPFTSSREICGIGGMLGNNASGEQSVKHGAVSENVSRLKVVLYDGNEYEFGPLNRVELELKKQQPDFEGEIYRRVDKLLNDNRRLIAENRVRTKKNAAGYALWELWQNRDTEFNLSRLFIGAQGTLGVITEAELDLIAQTKHRRLIVTPISNIKDLPEVVRTSLYYDPISVETFDYHTYELAKQYYPEHAARAHVADGKPIVVLSVFDGNHQDRVDSTAGKAKDKLESLGHQTFWLEDDAAVESFLTIRRKSFGMLLEHPSPNTRAQAFLEDSIVPLEHYDVFLEKLERILEEYNLIYTYAGHIGDGSIRLIPLINVADEGAPRLIFELNDRLNNLVIELGGSISVDHNDGLIRTPYLEQQFGTELNKLFEDVKDIFDPYRIFNPGKKVFGSRQYAMDHLIRENAA